MKFDKLKILYIYVRQIQESKSKTFRKVKKRKIERGIKMALLQSYNINAMATQISREFYINENPEDKSYVLEDEMRLFAMDLKSRVTFISRAKS